MKTFKTIIRNFFGLQPPTGKYFATIVDVKIKYPNHSRLPIVTFKCNLEDVETGEKFTHCETFIDNFYLLRCRDFMWFLESNGIVYADYFDLIGAVFDISIIHDCICGKKVPVMIYNDVITPPPSIFD